VYENKENQFSMSKCKWDIPCGRPKFESQVYFLYLVYKLTHSSIYFSFCRRYPTRTQYTVVVSGILNRLGITHDTKTTVSKSE
jgi:hypothetical protein